MMTLEEEKILFKAFGVANVENVRIALENDLSDSRLLVPLLREAVKNDAWVKKFDHCIFSKLTVQSGPTARPSHSS